LYWLRRQFMPYFLQQIESSAPVLLSLQYALIIFSTIEGFIA